MQQMKRLALAVALVAMLGVGFVGGAAAQGANPRSQHNGQAFPGYEQCETSPTQSQGTVIYGQLTPNYTDTSYPECNFQRRAAPDTTYHSACTANSAVNTSPPQAAGDNLSLVDPAGIPRSSEC